MRQLVISIIALFYLASCASPQKNKVAITQPELPISYGAFTTTDIEVVSEPSIFYLTELQKNEFFRHYNKSLADGRQAHEAVSDFLIERLGNFTYYGKTYTAEQAMRENKGNCMSLAILTTALAKLVDVEFSYREVSTVPIFEKHGNILLSSSHVQTKLFDKATNDKETIFFLTRRGIIVDYFPNSNNIKRRYLDYDQFVAMFYKNKASDALLVDDLNLAFANAIKAYHFDKTNPHVLNLLAVVHRRAGESDTAEDIYRFARTMDQDNISLLNNYIVLLNNQQRQEEVDRLKVELGKLDDPNPYSWLEQAYIALHAKEYRHAVNYFNKTIALAPYVHQAYLGLYQAYSERERPVLARNALEKGLEWTYDNKDRQKFKYKLYGRNGALDAFTVE